jgi:hypothetical protein
LEISKIEDKEDAGDFVESPEELFGEEEKKEDDERKQ